MPRTAPHRWARSLAAPPLVSFASPQALQGDWLREDLAAVDRSVTPWLIVTQHRPIYQGQEVEQATQQVGDSMLFCKFLGVFVACFDDAGLH